MRIEQYGYTFNDREDPEGQSHGDHGGRESTSLKFHGEGHKSGNCHKWRLGLREGSFPL